MLALRCEHCASDIKATQTLLVRLPQLHASHLPADLMVNLPIIGQLEHNEVGQVPQTCPRTLAEIGGWTQRARFWRIAVQYNEPQLVDQAETRGDLRKRLTDWLMGRLQQQ
jgi:hypothetical protein